MPSVQEALQRLDRGDCACAPAKTFSSEDRPRLRIDGAGGDIRIAVQKRLHEMVEAGQIRGCIFGENWSKTDEADLAFAAGAAGIEERSGPGTPQSRDHDRTHLKINRSAEKVLSVCELALKRLSRRY